MECFFIRTHHSTSLKIFFHKDLYEVLYFCETLSSFAQCRFPNENVFMKTVSFSFCLRNSMLLSVTTPLSADRMSP